MKIALIASEMAPFAKTGGLADVAGALPRALQRQGHEVVAILPKYKVVSEGGYALKSTGADFSVPVGAQSIRCSIEQTPIPGSKLPVYLVACNRYFNREGLYQDKDKDYSDNLQRFVLFCQAALEALTRLGFQPDLIHINDWQTALIPVYLRIEHRNDSFYRNTKSLLTIHNLAYQGLFPKEQFEVTGLPRRLYGIQGFEFYGKVNILKGGLLFADHLTTVSRQYSVEIQTEDFGCGLQGVLSERKKVLSGILNGVDEKSWNPRKDPLIAANYSVDDLSGKALCKAALQQAVGLHKAPEVPLVGIVSRLVEQKGVDLVADILEDLLNFPAQFVLLGTGDPKYHKWFEERARRHPKKCAVVLGFDNPVAHKIEAGADLFLMPSRFEPCGLNQMYSLKYGTVPVVRDTGGLADTVIDFDAEPDRGNGFLFEAPEAKAFLRAVRRALNRFADKDSWRRLMIRGMRQDFSWDRAARQYGALYKRMWKNS